MTDLSVGLVGGGMVAAYHLEGWRQVPDAKVVALAEPDPDRRSQRALAYGIRGYPSLAEMLAAETLDAIDIVAPVEHHAALVLGAVSEGLPVMCQKPLTPDAASAGRLIAELGEDARVMLHENWRWRRPYRLLKSALEMGDCSTPERFEMRVESSGLLPDQDGRLPALERQPFLAEMDRLIVFELLIHHLDVLEFLFGPATILGARLAYRCPDVRGEDRAEIQLRVGRSEGRLIGDFMVPGSAVVTDRLRLNASEDAILDGWTLALPGQDAVVTDPVAGYQDSYTATVRHFAESVRSDAPFETPAERGLHLLRLVETVYGAAHGG